MAQSEDHPKNCFGRFSCLAFTDPVLDSRFWEQVTLIKKNSGWNASCPGYTTCVLTIPYLDIQFTKRQEESSNQSESEENSDSWSYDESHLPREGDEYQVSFIPERKEDHERDSLDLGELVWNPESIQSERLQKFLDQTKVDDVLDFDDIWDSCNNEDQNSAPELDQQIKEIRDNLWTMEEALTLLHKNNYDVEKSIEAMNQTKSLWSSKKRRVGTQWSQAEIDKFELGMHNHDKDFRKIVRDELVGEKTFTDAVQYYYIWKKSLRCKIWSKRNKSLYGSLALQNNDNNLYTRNKAPIKTEASFRHLISDGRLRNRPRIDYSTTTWTQSNRTRKPRDNDSSSESSEGDSQQEPRQGDNDELTSESSNDSLVKFRSSEETSPPSENMEDIETELTPLKEPTPAQLTVSVKDSPKTTEEPEEAVVTVKPVSPTKIAIQDRVKNSNQKSYYPFHHHLKHSNKKRKVSNYSISNYLGKQESPQTPEASVGTPDIVDEDEDPYDPGFIPEEDSIPSPKVSTKTKELTKIIETENASSDLAVVESKLLKPSLLNNASFANGIGTNSPPSCIITNIDTQTPIPNTTLIMNTNNAGSLLTTKFVRQEPQTPQNSYPMTDFKKSPTIDQTKPPTVTNLSNPTVPPTPSPISTQEQPPPQYQTNNLPAPQFLFPPPAFSSSPAHQQQQQRQAYQRQQLQVQLTFPPPPPQSLSGNHEAK